MWNKDWADTAVVVAWIAIWSTLVYFVPLAAFELLRMWMLQKGAVMLLFCIYLPVSPN